MSEQRQTSISSLGKDNRQVLSKAVAFASSFQSCFTLKVGVSSTPLYDYQHPLYDEQTAKQSNYQDLTSKTKLANNVVKDAGTKYKKARKHTMKKTSRIEEKENIFKVKTSKSSNVGLNKVGHDEKQAAQKVSLVEGKKHKRKQGPYKIPQSPSYTAKEIAKFDERFFGVNKKHGKRSTGKTTQSIPPAAEGHYLQNLAPALSSTPESNCLVST